MGTNEERAEAVAKFRVEPAAPTAPGAGEGPDLHTPSSGIDDTAGTGPTQGSRRSTATSDSERTRGRDAEDGPDVWKWLLGILAVGGTAYGVMKHSEAEEHAAAADHAKQQADAHRAAAQKAKRHAKNMEAKAASERQRADIAEGRARKLAIDIASAVNGQIAELWREAAPPLRFEGCFAAATNGVHICIDMTWLLTGIVDPAVEQGSIFGRVVGVVAHEWYHFLDTGRGTRDRHTEELLGDAFAGRQLARLGVAPKPFADLLRQFPQSSTHPAGHVRAEAMLNAWTSEIQKKKASEAERLIDTTTASVVEPAVPTQQFDLAQAPRRRTRKAAAKKGAAKKSAAKKGAAKKGAAKKGAAKKGAEKGAAKKGATP